MAEDFPPPPVTDTRVHATLRPRTRIRVRWEAFAVLIIAMTVSFVIGMSVQWRIDHQIPPCTDKIATEGGVCQGPIQ